LRKVGHLVLRILPSQTNILKIPLKESQSLFLVSSNKDFNIYDLDKNIDPVLLKGLGDILEKSAEININADMSDDELDKLNDKIFEDIKNWDLPKREVLNVTLVSKILNNMEYTFKNMNPTLLKEELYKRNYTYDLLWVWFALNRQKQRGIKRDI